MVPKNILITGGLGFIGSNLAERAVELGNNVTILSRSTEKERNIRGIEKKVKLILKDVREIGEEVKGMDYIFHCASTVDNYNIHDNPYLDIEVNCNGTIALLEEVRKHNKNAKVIYPSTFFVNGNLRDLPANPDSPCEPRGLYPATRLAGEHFCRVYKEVFGINFLIARITNVFGIKEQRENKKKAAFNYLIGLALANKEIPVYDSGNFKRDYIYVSDVVDGLITLSQKGESGQVYYVGSGKPIRFRDLIELVIEEAQGGKIKGINPPEFHSQVGIKDYWCDNTPLKQLGWEPKISLREGIRRTVEYYRNVR